MCQSLGWIFHSKCSFKSRRKNSKMFPYGVSFPGVFDEIFIEVLQFHKRPLTWKISGCAPALTHYFSKMLHLKCLPVFWIRHCLDNCSVICTVTLWYVLHQNLRHVQNSGTFSNLFFFFQVYAGIFKHTQRYWDIFTRIETLLRHVQAYAAIFSTLCIPRIFTTMY